MHRTTRRARRTKMQVLFMPSAPGPGRRLKYVPGASSLEMQVQIEDPDEFPADAEGNPRLKWVEAGSISLQEWWEKPPTLAEATEYAERVLGDDPIWYEAYRVMFEEMGL
jgi:hypothetical protein